jgi:collagen type I alpha
MTRTKSTIGISAAALFASALLGVACSSDSTTPTGGAGSAGAAGLGSAGAGNAGAVGSAGTGGLPGTGGWAGSAGSVAGGGAGAGGAVNNCTPLPTSLLLTDFSPATFKGTDGSSWKAGKTDLWGSASSLTGGDIFYQGKAGSAPKATLHGQTLTISATIEAGDYAGYMFNFGPKCTNASGTQGLQFDVLPDSTLGNSTLKVQMQQRSDYPSTANPSSRPGDCVPTSMATQYNDCLSPALTVSSSGSTLTSGTVQLPWTNFGGGAPVYAVDSGQLMAIQWQFECPPGGGTVVEAGGSGSGGSSGAAGSAGGGAGSGGSSAGADTGGVGSGGMAGSGGASAGTSGASGSGGTSGSSGAAGTEAASGASGTAGSIGAAGSSGAASETAGTGGSASTTPPCVVSLTIDNVTFY